MHSQVRKNENAYDYQYKSDIEVKSEVELKL